MKNLIEKYSTEYVYDGKVIGVYGVINNYVWFTLTDDTKDYKVKVVKTAKKILQELKKKHGYLFTFSENKKFLNKWHKVLGFSLKETFYENNIWVM